MKGFSRQAKGFSVRRRGYPLGEGGLPLGEAPLEMTEGLTGEAHMSGRRRVPRKGASFSVH